MSRVWRHVGPALVLATLAILPACQRTPQVHTAGPGRLAPAAPTVSEMEPAQNGTHSKVLPRLQVAQAALEPRPESDRPKDLPPATAHPSPVVDETMTIPSRELHGYSFPGVDEVQPAHKRAKAAQGKAADAPANLAAAAPPLAASALAAPPPGVDGPVPSPSGFANEPYTIGAGDTLEFQSFNDELLSRELSVRYDGFISLPLIPDLRVAELTREEAEALIRERYTSVFRNPQIALTVREATSRTYTLVGDVTAPGSYPFVKETSLIEAISMAGGLRQRNASSSVGGFVGVTGQLTKAMVVRMIEGQRAVLQFDLRGLGEPGPYHDAQAPIFPGDLIYIPEGVNLVYLLGESRNPVIVELTEGMTLLQLLSLSGGFDASTARLRHVVLIRQVEDGDSQVMTVNVRKMLKTGRDFPLNPGDIVYLPRKILVRVEEFVRRFTGSISPLLNMYRSAIDAYYAERILVNQLRTPNTYPALDALDALGRFGQSTEVIATTFGTP